MTVILEQYFFPGGHVENVEIFIMAVIREVYEETGLSIENSLLYGICHWSKSGTHHVIFLYRADIALRKEKFTGFRWMSLKKGNLRSG